MPCKKHSSVTPSKATTWVAACAKYAWPSARKEMERAGGARVLTLAVLVDENANVTLLTIYDKNEIDNVSNEYISWLISNHEED